MNEKHDRPDYLIALLETHHVKRAQLARFMGLSRSAVTRKLDGDRPLHFHEIKTICAYLRKLGVDVQIDRMFPDARRKSKRRKAR